jgi:fermentation-respiration switch protein FrsA (DUF1100 family)
VLQAGPQELPILFHITAGEEGLSATMDSPAQGAFGIAMDGVEVLGDTLTLSLTAAQASYRGVLQADGSLQGTWTQGPASLTLNMALVEEGAEAEETGPSIPDPSARPQTPRPPFPYHEEEVRFPNASAEIELAGTFTVPRGEGPFPAVALVSGSGPQDRDETLLGHKPFAVLADHLTRAGIAVLRYDDRGVGGSQGDFAAATSVDLASDAEAAAAWLGTRPEVDPARRGIVGHSEGGLIAPMVAARSDQVGFIVLLAGPGMEGAKVILDQSERISRAEGLPEDQVERSLAANRAVFEILLEDPDPDRARTRIRAVLEGVLADMSPEERAAEGITDESAEGWIQGQLAQLEAPWLRFFLTYDPIPALEATRVPVLALNGELDLQVPYEANLAAIRSALERGGNPDFTVASLPGLNHLFQNAETGAPTEYSRIDETMSPVVLERVSGWILERFGSR